MAEGLIADSPEEGQGSVEAACYACSICWAWWSAALAAFASTNCFPVIRRGGHSCRASRSRSLCPNEASMVRPRTAPYPLSGGKTTVVLAALAAHNRRAYESVCAPASPGASKQSSGFRACRACGRGSRRLDGELRAPTFRPQFSSDECSHPGEEGVGSAMGSSAGKTSSVCGRLGLEVGDSLAAGNIERHRSLVVHDQPGPV